MERKKTLVKRRAESKLVSETSDKISRKGGGSKIRDNKIRDEDIIYIIEEKLPEIVKKRPSIKDKLKQILSDKFAEREDILKILEELRLQRESSDRKFQEMLHEIAQKFEEIQKENARRFDKMTEENKKRFEEILKEDVRRFDQIQQENNMKFQKMTEESEKRFQEMREESERRFKEMREESERRFQEFREDIERRFREFREDIERRFQEFREDIERRFREFREDIDKRFQEFRQDMDRRFQEIREDMNQRFAEVYEEIKKIRQDMHNAITSIGSRWGVSAERAFREGLKEILGKYFNADVREIYIEDKEEIVKGRPAVYQVDILVQNKHHILIEIKAQATDWEVLQLHRIGQIYEKQNGVKPRLILLTSYAREEAWEEARVLGDVEILTSPRDFKP